MGLETPNIFASSYKFQGNALLTLFLVCRLQPSAAASHLLLQRCGGVPSPWPRATCRQKGLFMWPQMDLLIVAALSRPSWPPRLRSPLPAGQVLGARRSQRGSMSLVSASKSAPPGCTLQICTPLPFLSPAWLWKPLQICSNIGHMDLKNTVHSLEHFEGKR